ncbi:MAG: 6-bladed beta-propeller, partial [Candidatus Aminicenantes bacterium]|nr:6-bladed beta-propeller [Candidatus Aminicenantes bacterium]
MIKKITLCLIIATFLISINLQSEETKEIDLHPVFQFGGLNVLPQMQLNRPSDFLVTDNNEIIISDTDDHCVVLFSTDGTFIRRIGRKGQGPGEFIRPVKVSLLEDNLLVADSGNYRIQILTKSGECTKTYRFTESTLLGIGANVFFTNQGDYYYSTNGLASPHLIVHCSLEGEKLAGFGKIFGEKKFYVDMSTDLIKKGKIPDRYKNKVIPVVDLESHSLYCV